MHGSFETASLRARSGSETAQPSACWAVGIGAQEYLRLVLVVGDVQISQVTASAEGVGLRAKIALRNRNGPVSPSVTTGIGARECLRLDLEDGDVQLSQITASAGGVGMVLGWC